MIDPGRLLVELLDEVRAVEKDLRQNIGLAGDANALRVTYERQVHEMGIGTTFSAWVDEQVDCAAVCWVLASVFVRYVEDNQLLPGVPLLSGEDQDGVRAAETGQTRWFAENPSATLADFLMAVFRRLSQPGGIDVLGAAIDLLARRPISAAAAARLIAFWRRVDADGAAVHRFRDVDLSTVFTEVLYEDLSRSARNRYALLTTPEMVVSLVLDHTLNPRLEDDPAELRIIDPACGSGRFLLSAFERVVRAWEQWEPTASRVERVLCALRAVHGVDRYLPAVMITRFRLLVAALRLLDGDPLPGEHDFNVVVGDALLPAPADVLVGGDEPGRLGEMLTPGRYDVVVSEPPYITVADRALASRYRERYPSCTGHFALTVPFAELMFGLAVRGDQAGHVGQFVSNAFMKREFGKRLVEDFYGERATLTHVLDTSGAYIPDRGTPTVVLIGRNRRPVTEDEILVVAGLRGEPTLPDRPEDGVVWRSISRQSWEAGLSSEWSSSFTVDRGDLAVHPWSLSPPRTAGFLERMAGGESLGDRAIRIGYAATTGSDSVFVAPPRHFERVGAEGGDALVPVITGSEVRDWTAKPVNVAFFPRDRWSGLVDIRRYPGHLRRLWPYRTSLLARSNYSGRSYREDGRAWFDWHQVTYTQDAHEWSITLSWVATHNQFALSRNRAMPLTSAPVIKLPKSATEEDHVGLLGLLNSSAACFWLKQHSQSKRHIVPGSSATAEPWMEIYEFTPSRLRGLPLPNSIPTRSGARLAELARQLVSLEPSEVLAAGPPTAERLALAKVRWHSVRATMIALQEELDWEVYHLYGLTHGEDLVAHPDAVPELSVGERAFELVLAERSRAGEHTTTWFERQGAAITTEVPREWPAEYQDVVERRVRAIRDNPELGLVERPEYKRRWTRVSWEDLQDAALESWILDRCEDPRHWFALDGTEARPRPLTVAELARQVASDPAVAEVVTLYAPGKPVVDVIASCVEREYVPYLAALRMRESGLAKRAEWERVWRLQHEEDVTDSAGPSLPLVPPSYSSTDYLKIDYWRLRGKFDVPHERFVSYPRASAKGRKDMLLGWAGWDERQRAAVLMGLLAPADTLDRSSALPLLAGLLELSPWMTWLAVDDSGADVTNFLNWQLQRWDATADELRAWRPPKSRRGRPPKNLALPSS
ncbi:BREX-2 system adenine-specific DNA-methyltransferase PglX [Lentzea sp. NPDC004789]